MPPFRPAEPGEDREPRDGRDPGNDSEAPGHTEPPQRPTARVTALKDRLAADEPGQALRNAIDAEDIRSVLEQTFFLGADAGRDEVALGAGPDSTRRNARKTAVKSAVALRESSAKSYDVICISLYKDDLRRLDQLTAKLKQRGKPRVSRSAVIRAALEQFKLEDYA